MEEVWRDIPEYEEMYQVSNLGRVRSLDRLSSDGRRYTGKLMKLTLQRTRPVGSMQAEYRVVGLTKNGKQKVRRVHDLVLTAFVGPRPEGMLGLHRDDDQDNNTLANLYWGTPRENALDAIRNGKLVIPPRNLQSTCRKGHTYTEANSKFTASGYRHCRLCEAINVRDVAQQLVDELTEDQKRNGEA